MLKFRQYLKEWGDFSFPTSTLVVNKVNLHDKQTRQELNRNLALATTGHSINPYTDWFRVTKVLNLYGISLPKVNFTNMDEGEEVVAIDQYGAKKDDAEQLYYYYCWELQNDGHYETRSMVLTGVELEKRMEDEQENGLIGHYPQQEYGPEKQY